MCSQKEPDFKFDWFDLMMRWFLACGIGFNLLIFFVFLYWLLK